ncbi:MAG: hypothetical protein UV71_C0001G0081 [Microgenomates group bacterium GW2011_GWC1_43_13]|uniref:Uncharacterized protein n=3 Tax=Candidatus Woeseibacteriota TaxID=1752722 RepID=A0A837IFJ8_9BACT|nr:MAG: hypothetical protein UV71_C0001G0081 [Microgenomates group bacterium GW2011_GWC1_43_13]KKT33337.1 MAG: hypothetical protein UW20_C0003G0028 [Candidatus Woesebacteria bacterium GW2011_GWB1_44_11]KKT54621.1 MAG: hypothetical protein UW47_C0004G0028 [Candidatus Woesebacteria bacterium GW2011_GWA1_44_23]OGM76885.1 MAG: hypothetical protein A2208_00935 [Candidatus Woesebacteria bacterium RIFOXYA1_FULL_43_16]OGM81605.1 MAG: hypothetical protein A2394_02190 [Candidatus Woesebacteria bacterium 
MFTKRVNKVIRQLLVFIAALFVLLLSAANIESYQSPKKVLGAESQVNSNDKFWEEFLEKNPDYIPGWIEVGRIDKVNEIDPNYFTP